MKDARFAIPLLVAAVSAMPVPAQDVPAVLQELERLMGEHKTTEALAVLDRAIAAHPRVVRLLELRASNLLADHVRARSRSIRRTRPQHFTPARVP